MAQIILDSNNNLIQGDFDNATLNNRTKLQTTTTNATTNVYVVPNGSSTSAGVSVANNSNLTNASKIVMATNGTTDTQIISGVNGSGTYLPLSFYTNNALAMQIGTNGRVGIGTASPADPLTVNNDGVVTGEGWTEIARISNTAQSKGFNFGYNASANNATLISQSAGAASGIEFWGYTGSAWAERMRIDSSGTLLVGTTTPISASVTPRIFSYAGADTNTTIQTMPCGLALNNAANANSSGYGVSLKFHMSFPGESGKYAAIAGVSDGTFANAVALVFYTTQNATGGADNVTERMRISATGSLILVGSTAQKASGTTWSNPSDQRLKDNIRDYTKGTAELMQVRVREWEYNGKGGTTEGMKGLGVVADEIMTILPNTVETYNAKLNADDEEDTAIKKFDATEITWLLVKTVQEQQAIINELKTRIEALESK